MLVGFAGLGFAAIGRQAGLHRDVVRNAHQFGSNRIPSGTLQGRSTAGKVSRPPSGRSRPGLGPLQGVEVR